MTTPARPAFVELPAAAAFPAACRFYEAAFGWDLTGFGPSYACTMTGAVDVGLQGDAAEAPRAPLPVLGTEDLEAALASVERAGGRVTVPIFAFPGGRRFHFADPAGNELAVMQAG